MSQSTSKARALEKKARLMMEVLVNRTDIYAEQWANGERHGYRAVRERLTRELIEKHIQGELTLGFYALSSESTAKWMVIDADTTVVSELEEVMGQYRELGLPEPIIEFSGRRGFHFIWLFSEPVPGWQAKALGEAITSEHEIFPKQGAVSKDTSSPGSLVKAPLSIHRASGRPSVFVNQHFEEIGDPWTHLESAERVNIEDFGHLLSRQKPQSKGRGGGESVNILRPCIARALRNGADQGARNRTGHVIASELRRLGRSRQEAAGALACWNLRNRPPLPKGELATILDSAYSGEPYFYSCHPDGPLRRIVQCVGEGKCEYKQALRRAQQANKETESEEGS